MSSYLKIAEFVLQKSKRSLTAKEILEAAYKLQIVPTHLFGKTQHKTLQARLSEDVLYNKSKTVFVRTGPGRFALRNGRDDAGHFKARYIAPLRSYQLKRFEVICVQISELDEWMAVTPGFCQFKSASELFLKHMPLLLAENDLAHLPLQLLVTIRHSDCILSILSENTQESVRGRGLGFFGYVKEDDADLFSNDPFGFESAARRIISEQTRIPISKIDQLIQLTTYADLVLLYLSGAADTKKVALVITAYEAIDPDIVINNIPSQRLPRWTKAFSGINDTNSLENISKQILSDPRLADLVIGGPSR